MNNNDTLPGSLLADTAKRARAMMDEIDTRRLSEALKALHTLPLEDARRRVAAIQGTLEGVAYRAREALHEAGIERFGSNLPTMPPLDIESHHDKLMRRLQAAGEAQRQHTQNLIEKLWPTKDEASKN